MRGERKQLCMKWLERLAQERFDLQRKVGSNSIFLAQTIELEIAFGTGCPAFVHEHLKYLSLDKPSDSTGICRRRIILPRLLVGKFSGRSTPY